MDNSEVFLGKPHPPIAACVMHPTVDAEVTVQSKKQYNAAFAGVVYGLCQLCMRRLETNVNYQVYIDKEIQYQTAELYKKGLHNMATGRFDYVAYDDKATQTQASAKSLATTFENFIEQNIKSPRAKALALTNLEEVYMWIGKAIRDDQITRNGAAPLQEGRGNG